MAQINPRFPGVEVQPGATVDPQAKVGEGTFVRPGAVVRQGVMVGQNCNIHSGVYIEEGVIIGNECKLMPGAKLFHGVTVEDKVFMGPGMVTTNDLHPRADIPNDNPTPTLFQYGASVGAGARILCGTVIGRRALVGMGAVVTRDVLPYSLVIGHPARRVGWVNEEGQTISRDPNVVPDELVPLLKAKHLMDGVSIVLGQSQTS